MRQTWLAMVSLLAATAAADVTLVENGKPAAVVVTAAKASKTTAYAVKELVDHVRLVSGAELAVTTENKLDAGDPRPLILVGPGRLAGALAPGTLQPDETRVVVKGNRVALVGGDKRDFELTPGTVCACGTLYAVYDFLETELGVRWLWPGEAGAVTPKRFTIRVAETSRAFVPPLIQRQIRPGTGPISDNPQLEAAMKALGWTEAEEARKAQAFDVWARRRRMGRSVAAQFGHAFTGWLAKYGKDHPEWFAMMPDGKRVSQMERPYPRPERVKLCVTAPGLADEVARLGLESLKKTGRLSFSACPNDSRGYCYCEKCRALDPPEGIKDVMNYPGMVDFLYPSLSDRYVWFWNQIAARMGDECPGQYIGVYAYSNYHHAPLREKPSPRLLVAYVGFNYFNAAYNEQSRKDWAGWSAHGSKMFLRPNLLLTGHGFPANYARDLGADLKQCARTGMIGTDFDSMTHHYAAQAPVFDMLTRMMWNPDADVDAAYADFLRSAYGAAEPAMRRYWDALEKMTREVAGAVSLRSKLVEEGAEAKSFEDVVPEVYTPEAVNTLAGCLAEARRLAAGDEGSLKRIEVAAVGLEYGAVQSAILGGFRRFRASQGANAGELRSLLKRKRDLFTAHCNDLTLGLKHVMRYELAAFFARQYATDFGEYLDRPAALRWLIEWRFAKDPEAKGEALGYAKPGFDDKAWMMVAATGPWEQQNVPYYDGVGWFRIKVNAPSEWKTLKRLTLQFNGVGDIFRLYVNGQQVHETTGRTKWPLEVDLKGAIKPGQENSIVVRVNNEKGSGGLLKPVILAGER
ncbi:MAG TPA: DUF4838 domain-containing protein [Candidatus Brocadiia bacterium]|nr:DUF4838 domain-containing protein [Candidatus Brocadiia bacterium]